MNLLNGKYNCKIHEMESVPISSENIGKSFHSKKLDHTRIFNFVGFLIYFARFYIRHQPQFCKGKLTIFNQWMSIIAREFQNLWSLGGI